MEHNSWKNQDIRIASQYAHLHNMSLLATKFHKLMFCSFREVGIGTDCTGSCKSNYHRYDHDHDDPRYNILVIMADMAIFNIKPGERFRLLLEFKTL
jgi:hypothetical protein